MNREKQPEPAFNVGDRVTYNRAEVYGRNPDSVATVVEKIATKEDPRLFDYRIRYGDGTGFLAIPNELELVAKGVER